MKMGFLGAGKMATAFVRGLISAKVCAPDEILVSDVNPAYRDEMVSQLGVRPAETNAEAAKGADVIMLCVKPGDVRSALQECGITLEKKLLLSIVSGLTIHRLTGIVPNNCRIVRAMPNMAAQVGQSATVYAASPDLSESDLDVVQHIFNAVGLALPVPEDLIDAATGLSGSGPAYVYLMIEALSDGGVAEGLSRAIATRLAIQTVLGAASAIAGTSTHPAVLREAVTSPAGTTAAGLAVLESAATRAAFANAVRAAAARAREIK